MNECRYDSSTGSTQPPGRLWSAEWGKPWVACDVQDPKLNSKEDISHINSDVIAYSAVPLFEPLLLAHL